MKWLHPSRLRPPSSRGGPVLILGVFSVLGLLGTNAPLTGASMNPARSLGPAVAGGIWTAHWIDWAALPS